MRLVRLFAFVVLITAIVSPASGALGCCVLGYEEIPLVVYGFAYTSGGGSDATVEWSADQLNVSAMNVQGPMSGSGTRGLMGYERGVIHPFRMDRIDSLRITWVLCANSEYERIKNVLLLNLKCTYASYEHETPLHIRGFVLLHPGSANKQDGEGHAVRRFG
jgi:hypothetical protein